MYVPKLLSLNLNFISFFLFCLQFHQKESSYVELDMILPRGSSLGLYARKNAIPTLTLNDIHDVLSGFRNDNRISRSIVSCYNFM